MVRAASQLTLATRDALATLHLLLAAGADVGAAGERGRTALHAAAGGSLPGVRLLLRAGADPGRRDASGRTPRDLAELALHFRSTPELEEVVDLLAAAERGPAERGPVAIAETPEELIAAAENPADRIREGLEALGGLGKLIKSLTGQPAAEVPGATPAHPLGPLEVSLEPDPEAPDSAVEAIAASLEGIGCVRAGAYALPEMPGVRLVGLVHEEKRLLAAVYRHPAAERPICDLVLETTDGTSVTVSNAPRGGELEAPPGHEKHFRKSFDALKLHRHMRSIRGDRAAVAVGPEDFRSRFEEDYRQEMEWRAAQGVSGDEIRRIAKAGGQPATDEEIRRVQELLRPREDGEG